MDQIVLNMPTCRLSTEDARLVSEDVTLTITDVEYQLRRPPESKAGKINK